VFDPLSAEARVANGWVPAFFVRANVRHRLDVVTDVAAQFLLGPVIRERQAAIGTFGNITALWALEAGGVAAPVQKQNGLLAAFEPLVNCFFQLRRKNQVALFLPRSL